MVWVLRGALVRRWALSSASGPSGGQGLGQKPDVRRAGQPRFLMATRADTDDGPGPGTRKPTIWPCTAGFSRGPGGCQSWTVLKLQLLMNGPEEMMVCGALVREDAAAAPFGSADEAPFFCDPHALSWSLPNRSVTGGGRCCAAGLCTAGGHQSRRLALQVGLHEAPGRSKGAEGAEGSRR